MEANKAALFFSFLGGNRFLVPSLPAHDLKDARELASTPLLIYVLYSIL